MVEQALSPSPAGAWLVWFLPTFFPVSCWLFLKASFFTNIEAKEGKLVVKNFFSKHVIPVARFSKVTWDGGVEIVTDDGGRYWCLNLGGSLVGALFGYPTNRRCAKGIEEYVSMIRELGVDSSDGGVDRASHLNLSFLGGAMAFAFLLYFSLAF